MDSPVLDMRFSLGVVQGRGALTFERLCGQRDDILFPRIRWLELRLDTVFPLIFHNLPDSCLAQSFPFRPEAAATHVLKRLVDKDSAT